MADYIHTHPYVLGGSRAVALHDLKDKKTDRRTTKSTENRTIEEEKVLE